MPENKNPGQKSHTHEAIPFQLPGGAMFIWRSLGSDILAQNWKSMWKPYTVSILYFIGKKILLVIFQTLFTENCQFFEDFDQNLFLSKLWKGIYKNCPKIYHKWDFRHFSLIPFHYLGKNRFWSKSSKNWQFSVNKVWKITNNIFFPLKYKMLAMVST